MPFVRNRLAAIRTKSVRLYRLVLQSGYDMEPEHVCGTAHVIYCQCGKIRYPFILRGLTNKRRRSTDRLHATFAGWRGSAKVSRRLFAWKTTMLSTEMRGVGQAFYLLRIRPSLKGVAASYMPEFAIDKAGSTYRTIC